MKMRGKSAAAAAFVAIVAAAGCAKQTETPANEAEKRYFDAWMEIHHPDVTPTEHWVYIIDEEKTSSTSPEALSKDYVFVTYTQKDLSGNISETTDSLVAKQLNQFQRQNYYGPAVWYRPNMMSGIYYAIEGMDIGDFRSVVIPGWFMGYDRYDSEEAYLANVTGGSNAIYDIKVTGQTDDIIKWQIDSMSIFVGEDKFGMFRQITPSDSTEYGFYYEGIIQDENGETVDTPEYLESISEDEEHESLFPQDTTVYINYTGRRLDGQAFDTTDEITAKDNGIYSSDKTYEPMPVSWGENYSELELDGNSVITGFAKTLWRMSQVEGVKKAAALFYSELGYSYSGSGDMIPAYAPLIFEIEFTENPEE